MNVTKITFPCDDPGFLDTVLSMRLENDYVLDNFFIELEIDDIDPINYLYRRYYEQVFLRRVTSNLSEFIKPGFYKLKLSVGEAMTLINGMIPPKFAGREHELYPNMEELIKSLEYFLTDIESGTLDYQLAKFKQMVGWQPFETKSNYDPNRIEIIRKNTNNTSGPVIDLVAFKYDKESDDICMRAYTGIIYEDDEVTAQFVFHFTKKKDLFTLYKILDENKFMRITNVFGLASKGYYVYLYTSEYTTLDNPTLSEILHKSYSFMNKE